MTEPPTVRSKGPDRSSKSIQTLSRTFELTAKLLHVEKVEAFLQGIAESVRSQFGFDRVSISVLDEDRGVFTDPAMAGYSDHDREEALANQDAFSYNEIMQDFREDCRVSRTAYFIPYEKQNSPLDGFILVRDAQSATLPRESPEAWHELDLLYFALKDQMGDIIGYMQVDYPRDNLIPSLETIHGVELFASIAAVGIENSKMFRRTRAYLDLLTHDVGNLVTPIDVYLDVVLGTTNLTNDQVKYISTARECARNISVLVENLRQSTKGIGGLHTFRVPQDLAAILRESAPSGALVESSLCGVLASDLHGIIKGIMDSEPLDVVLLRIARTISGGLGARSVLIGVRNDDSGLFQERVMYGYSSEQLARIPKQSYTMERMKYDLREEFAIAPDTYYVRPLESGVVHQDDLKYASSTDLLYVPRKTESEWQELDYIDFIIKDKEGNWIGWLEFLEPTERKAPTADVIERIRVLADLAGIAIESQKLRAASGR
jgi:GAF domain-containing protein